MRSFTCMPSLLYPSGLFCPFCPLLFLLCSELTMASWCLSPLSPSTWLWCMLSALSEARGTLLPAVQGIVHQLPILQKFVPMQISFLSICYPVFVLTYLGQAAWLTSFPDQVSSTFYASIPFSDGFFWVRSPPCSPQAVVTTHCRSQHCVGIHRMFCPACC